MVTRLTPGVNINAVFDHRLVSTWRRSSRHGARTPLGNSRPCRRHPDLGGPRVTDFLILLCAIAIGAGLAVWLVQYEIRREQRSPAGTTSSSTSVPTASQRGAQ
jgi:hypothetical protein